MNAVWLRFALALFIPAAVLSWRHSKLVALAIAIPFVANVYVMCTGVVLSAEHPSRVLVPVVSAMLGFAEAYAEGRHEQRLSRACVLGLLVFALGGTDVLALPTFAVFDSWYPVWVTMLVCPVLIVVAAIPERKLPWLKNCCPS